MKQVKYDKNETEFLVDSFRNGFPLHYSGEQSVRMRAPNLKLKISSETELLNKVIKEAKLKRFTGPYKGIPFEHFTQSPIGLVPKDGGKGTRLILHLSYPRNKGTSVNANIPAEKCLVKYPDFNEAVQMCIASGISSNVGKSDMKSAFRNLCMRRKDFCWLVMKAHSPFDRQWYYFVDKCLPFGSLISCAHFQPFSNSIAFIIKVRSGHRPINYLDDFLFTALRKLICDSMIAQFPLLCKEINFPFALEKTE